MSGRSLVKMAEYRLRKAVIGALSALVRRSSPPPGPQDLHGAKILLIRQDRIGDILVSTPFIAALARHYPTASLDMLVSTNNHMVVEGIPQIRQRWIYAKSFGSLIMLLRNIRKERYDVAIDLMDNSSATSTIFCLLSGARWTFGISKENEFIYDVKVLRLSRRDVHIVRRIAELLRPFDIDPDREELRIFYEPGHEASQRSQRALAGQGLSGKKCICINMSAGSSSRFWGIDNYISLVQKLEKAYPAMEVVIVCAPGDTRSSATVAQASSRSRLLAPTHDFQEFASNIRAMACIITPDTAVVHLAAAFKVPCIALYIQTESNLRIWEPYHSPHRSLISRENSLRSIPVDEVLRATTSLLREHPAVRRRNPVKKR